MIPHRDDDPTKRPVLVESSDFHEVTEIIAAPTETKLNTTWILLLMLSGSFLCLMVGLFGYLFWEGTGIWGVNVPVAWGFAIVNFIWWIGIGHAGTLISASLFLFRQKWRTGINRFSEAMTIFAVMCAGVFPAFHVGRIWVVYYIFPLPNQMAAWPNTRSPLFWDVFAISTYFTVSLLFWYMGLIPDLATLRDRANTKVRKFVLSVFALGWRGAARHWQNYERAYLTAEQKAKNALRSDEERAADRKAKRGTRPTRSKAAQAAHEKQVAAKREAKLARKNVSTFNVQIPDQAASDRTNSIKGKL